MQRRYLSTSDEVKAAYIAEQSGLAFEQVVRRMERGLPLPHVPDETWMCARAAADSLRISVQTLYDGWLDGALERQSRSAKKYNGHGTGYLVRRDDVRRVKNIMRNCGSTFRMSCRFLAYLKQQEKKQ